MSRHHPYGGGGGYDDFGPPGGYDDRPPRGRGRGGGPGRGRGGGGGGWDGPGPDRDYGMRGPPSSGPYRGYDDYDPSAPRGRGGRGRGGRGGGPGRPRYDDDVYDAIMDERINRERQCRTLFVRNIKYGTDPAEVRDKFERIGEIKTFFDLSHNRGMVFITYYDLRSATLARDRLNATEIGGRPIDVHYSLPKDNELEKRCDRDKNQGTLFITLTGASRPFTDDEIRAHFGTFGDIKNIKPFKDSPNHRFIEFWDSRACEAAHDNLVGTEMNGGRLDLKFSWDTGMVPSAKLVNRPRDGRGGASPPRDNGYGRRAGPRDETYGGGGYRDEYANGAYNGGGGGGYGGPPPGGRDGGYGPPPGREGGYGPPPRDGYGPPPGPGGPSGPYGPPAGGYGAPPPMPPQQAAPPTMGARLDQAQKVQELLASLTRAGGVPPPGPPPMQGGPPSQPYMPPPQQQQPPPQQPPYQPPYGEYGGYGPPGPPLQQSGQFSPPPPQQSPYRPTDPRLPPQNQPPPAAAPAPAAASSLPPAILALLSAAGGSQPPGQPGAPAASAPPPMPPAAKPPTGAPAGAPAPGQPNNQAVQQLLALLQHQNQQR